MIEDSTKQLLYLVNRHIGNRLQKQEFYCNLQNSSSLVLLDESFSAIHISIYPDFRKRKVTDKVDLVYHILEDHICNYTVTPGLYKYALSVSGKQRRWIRIGGAIT